MADRHFRVLNQTRGAALAEQSEKATTWWRRGVGLIGRKGLPEGGGLIIQPCNSVVSFFMRFTIDVIFVDDKNTVLHVLHSMVPWRTSRIVRGSKFVVELPAGKARETGTDVGDQLEISPV